MESTDPIDVLSALVLAYASLYDVEPGMVLTRIYDPLADVHGWRVSLARGGDTPDHEGEGPTLRAACRELCAQLREELRERQVRLSEIAAKLAPGHLS